MASRRDAVLEGTLAAARLHEELRAERAIEKFGGRVDVFRAILDRGAELLFKPLDGYLGVYLPAPTPGILVTTERSLAIQRYTAAHELGHFSLGHRSSIDDDAILNRSPFTTRYDPNEVAADAFAAAFLLPQWLVAYHAKRQGWTAANFPDPVVVYQLSLRAGVSYEATCRTLLQYQMIRQETATTLLGTPPKKIKQQLLGRAALGAWHVNVWLLTERDEDATVFAEPGDVFVVRLTEHSGSGYLWDVASTAVGGLTTVTDERLPSNTPNTEEPIGGATARVVTARADEPLLTRVDLIEYRPWDPSDVLARLSFAFDVRGRERGLSRADREKRLHAA